MITSGITQEVQRKVKRRQIEYLVLISVQGFFVGSFLDVMRVAPSIGLIICAGGLSWTLTQYRQKRCTLPENNRFRIIVDVIEVFSLLLFISVFSIVALAMNVNTLEFQAHMSLMLMTFFLGTVFTEYIWVQRVFPHLNSAQQINYVVNLNSSIILPFKISQLKRTFRWK